MAATISRGYFSGLLRYNLAMFGRFDDTQTDRVVEMVEHRIQSDSRYSVADSGHKVVVDTALGRVYINQSSYFSGVPESAWRTAFTDELGPRAFLEQKMGKELTDEDISYFKGCWRV